MSPPLLLLSRRGQKEKALVKHIALNLASSNKVPQWLRRVPPPPPSPPVCNHKIAANAQKQKKLYTKGCWPSVIARTWDSKKKKKKKNLVPRLCIDLIISFVNRVEFTHTKKGENLCNGACVG